MSDATYIQTSQNKESNEVSINATMGAAVPKGPADAIGDPNKKKNNDFLMGAASLLIAFYIGRKWGKK